MSEYTQGVAADGAAILKDGQPLTIEQILEALRCRDEYHDHLALIAEMTGNKGDIGAAHEGVNAVIEECAARLKRVDFLNQQNTALQEQIDALAAHMEKLSSNALALANACENKTDLPLHKWAVKCAMLVSRVQEAVKQLPSTSLTRRDSHPDCDLECGAYGTYCKCADEGHQ